MLLYALFYTSISQTAAYQSVMRAAGIDTWSSYQPQTQSESGAARPSDLEAPSGASMQPSRAVATASSTAPTVPSVCHALVLAVRALWMGRNGCHLMKPWWRHILFLASICLLSLLVAYSMSNMLFLVEAHCRDFLISSVLNAVLTFAAAIIILAVAFQRQDQLRQQQSNPFEAMGLLVSQDDAEGEDELDEFGLEEEPIDAGPEARTRRALEMEQSTQL